MNERIKQLMGQTLDEKFSGTWSVMDMQDLTKFADRFAEVIVAECAGLFPNVYVEIETDYGNTPVIAADYIKKHFGVKE